MPDLVNTMSGIIGINSSLFIVLIGIILGITVSVFVIHILTNFKNYLRNLLKKDGNKFEKECEKILKQNGWKTKKIGKSGDNGVDIFAQKGKLKVAIQCKNFKGKVDNKAVQEIYAGKDYYRLNTKFKSEFDSQYGIVVYRNKEKKYTAPAKDFADVLGIKFLYYKDLSKLEKYL